MIYLKLFDNEESFEEYIYSDDAVFPNTSLLDDEDEVIFQKEYPYYEGFAKLTLTDDSVIILQGQGELGTTIRDSYRYTAKKLEIGTQCTGVTDSACWGCENLESITIPTTITRIGKSSFISCYKLKSINIPGSVETLDTRSFGGCSALEKVTLHDGLKDAYNGAFTNTNQLASITIPSTVENLGVIPQNESARSAFFGTSMAYIRCEAMTAPTISDYTFQTKAASGTLSVPVGSTGYQENWMPKLNGWTLVEE